MNAPSPLYTRDILRLAASLAPFAPLPRSDGEAEVRSTTCGSRIKIAVTIDESRVAALATDVEACAFGQASTALMIAAAPGRDLAGARALLAGADAWLGGDDGAAPDLSVLAPARARPARHGAILLPYRALVAALEAAQ